MRFPVKSDKTIALSEREDAGRLIRQRGSGAVEQVDRIEIVFALPPASRIEGFGRRGCFPVAVSSQMMRMRSPPRNEGIRREEYVRNEPPHINSPLGLSGELYYASDP
jgi:hypothetical protein